MMALQCHSAVTYVIEIASQNNLRYYLTDFSIRVLPSERPIGLLPSNAEISKM
jgi:hypothetical protein